MIYFLKGSLPWMGIKDIADDQKNSAIYQLKVDTSPKELCEGCPKEFLTYLEYCRSLKFDSKPNYTYLRSLMKDAVIKSGEKVDCYTDWLMKKMGKEIPIS
jgi:hypothetical protein